MTATRRVRNSRILRHIYSCSLSFVIVYSCVTFTPVVKWITESMDQDWFDESGEVLVILAGSMLVPGTGPDATVGYDTYLRCTYASWILQQHAFRTVVVTGSQGAALAMQRFLVAHGTPVTSILMEDRANTTYENALYTRLLLMKQSAALPDIVVLTSDFHSWRALHVFRHLGFRTHMIPVPDVIKRSSSMGERWPLFLLEVNELAKDIAYIVTGRL